VPKTVLYHERLAKKNGYSVIIGVDEVGRGSLAGPVVVAAVSLKNFKFKNRIDDSKKLSVLQRQNAFFEISRKAVFDIGVVNEDVIDRINISKSANFAVDLAIARLVRRLKAPRPTFKNTLLLLDGRLDSSLGYPLKEIIGGDGLSLSIAAASIIAKVLRDRMMIIYHRVYPVYGFAAHKGYGTKRHKKNINKYGLSPIHRKTFCLRKETDGFKK
jgi:ribonuclease HII